MMIVIFLFYKVIEEKRRSRIQTESEDTVSISLYENMKVQKDLLAQRVEELEKKIIDNSERDEGIEDERKIRRKIRS